MNNLQYLVVYVDLLTGEMCLQDFSDLKLARKLYRKSRSAVLIDRSIPESNPASKGVVKCKNQSA